MSHLQLVDVSKRYGAVQAVGTFGVGVNYRITSNFSMGLEAIVHTNTGGTFAPWP